MTYSLVRRGSGLAPCFRVDPFPARPGKRINLEKRSSHPLDPDRTLTLVRSLNTSATDDRAPRPSGKSGPHSLWGYLLAAAVGALLVAFGILIGGLVRGMESWVQERGSQSSIAVHSPTRDVHAAREAVGNPVRSDAVSSDAPAVGRSSGGASIISGSEGTPETSSVESSADRVVAEPSSVRPLRSARPGPRTAQRVDKLVASRAIAIEPTIASTRYCARVGDTVFRQASSTGADDPEDLAAQAPRADSGLMRILFTVSAPPTFVALSFENGGDTSVHLRRLEESRSGRRLRILGAAVPASVPAGGLKELYRFPVAVADGETSERRFVAVDRKGDSWTAAVELVPCEN